MGNQESFHINGKEVSNNDFRKLQLLNLQLSALRISILSDLYAYESTLDGIRLVYNKYLDTPITTPNPDVLAIQSIALGFIAKIIITSIGFARYEELTKQASRGEIDFSLQPNVNINIANILSSIGYVYSLNGAQGIYERDITQPVFGI